MALRAQQRPSIQVVQASNIKQVRRVPRRPAHRFNLKAKPYEIVPFMIAPVLPGETLTNLLLQSRVVTDPIKNPLIGWHQEYYFFYVKHRGLSDWDTSGLLQSMMLDPTTDVSSLKAGANSVPYYTFKTGMNFVQKTLDAVVLEFFRDEGETTAPTVENYPAAQIDQEGWFHSIKLESETGDDTELPGVDEMEELDILPGFTTQYAQWEIMRDAGITDLTYEDFLRSYGVDIPKAEDQGLSPDVKNKPELIRFVRDWKYPSNTIDPTDGSPSSAVSWSLTERADKKRFFKEPGFIFGVSVTRPKIYLGNQKGAAVGMLSSAYSWLPAVLAGHDYTSIQETLDSATDGILQNQAEDYWLDVKDLFLYGDQFVNHAMAAGDNHGLGLPTATLDTKYLTDAMVESLFVTAGSEYVRQDGVCMLDILGRQVETTA